MEYFYSTQQCDAMKNVLVFILLYCRVERGLFVILGLWLENLCLSNFEINLDVPISSFVASGVDFVNDFINERSSSDYHMETISV